MYKAMLIAGIGGFIGTCGRFLIGKLAHHLFASPFPYGTFAVNVIGCFLIGLLFGLAEKTQLLSANLSLLLITGFCGGFTTFSTFSDELFLFLQQRQWGYFTLYLSLSIILGVVMVWVGRSLIKA